MNTSEANKSMLGYEINVIKDDKLYKYTLCK